MSPRPRPFVPTMNAAEEGTLKGQLIKLGMYTIAASFEAEAERAAKDETPYAAYLARLGSRQRPKLPPLLDTLALLLSDGHADAATLDWARLEPAHAVAVRARLAERYRRQLREALAAIDLTPGQGPPVIMLIRARAATEPVRFTETLPKGFSSGKQITWYEPEFVEGIESLGKQLEKLGNRDCKRLVIEIRDLALSLAHHLPQMLAKKRGRQ